MGRKAGITLEDVVEAAAAIADRDGLEAATLTAVAGELGIKTPSLYNHLRGLSGLRRLLAIHGSQLLLKMFEEAIGDLEGAEALGPRVPIPGLGSTFVVSFNYFDDDT